MPPLLGRAARRNGSCCGTPPGIDCSDYTRTKHQQRQAEKRDWRREGDTVDINYVAGDATNPGGDGPRIIAHIVNDRGWWGRGFVLAVSDRWPDVRREYQRWHQNYYGDGDSTSFRLGTVQFVSVGNGVEVANMIGQHGVRTTGGVPPIRYDDLERCLRAVAHHSLERRASVHMPRIGCGLAGGTWDRVEPLIVENLCDRGVEVTVYDLPQS